MENFLEITDEKKWGTTFDLINWWKRESVEAAHIMVVGAGALGNEVLKNLALFGVGHIFITDFDDIEYSNLARSVLFRERDCGKYKAEVAAERIKDINPNIKVKAVRSDVINEIGLGVFRRMDAIIGCLDNREARLYMNRHSYRVGKSWIDGGIENLAGEINVYTPNISCYECKLSQIEWDNIKFRLGCADVAKATIISGKIPTTPISSSIIGAMQVQEALKIIHKNQKQSLAGTRFFYEGMSNEFIKLKQKRLKEKCLSHQILSSQDIIESPLKSSMSLKDVFSWLTKTLQEEEITIKLPHEVVFQLATFKSEQVYDVVIPKYKATAKALKRYRTIPNERIIFTKQISEIYDDFEKQTLTLNELGVPPLQILTVETIKNKYFVELTGDKDEYFIFK
ncbi:MAG: ThiF family adenylyltransferase [Saprospiraceae bacterium]